MFVGNALAQLLMGADYKFNLLFKMPSYVKAALHTLVSFIAFVAPTIIANHASFFNMSIGAAVGLVLNFLLSHTVATTTGASARQ